MIKTKLFLTIFIGSMIVLNSANGSPTLFNNAMVFDNRNFALIDGEGTQNTYSGINDYLASYDTSITGTAPIVTGASQQGAIRIIFFSYLERGNNSDIQYTGHSVWIFSDRKKQSEKYCGYVWR